MKMHQNRNELQLEVRGISTNVEESLKSVGKKS